MDAPDETDKNIPVKETETSDQSSESGVKRPLCNAEENMDEPPEKKSKPEPEVEEKVIEEKGEPDEDKKISNIDKLTEDPNKHAEEEPDNGIIYNKTETKVNVIIDNKTETKVEPSEEKSEEKIVDLKGEEPDVKADKPDIETVKNKISQGETKDLSQTVNKPEEMEVETENDNVKSDDNTMSDNSKENVASVTVVDEHENENKQDDQSPEKKKEDIKENSEQETNGTVKSDNDMNSSQDSEKENMDVDAPMDLTTKTTPSNGQDVIMLSDEDEDPKKFTGDRELSIQELKLKQKMIKKLQAELRNEEAKLVLLKKLRFSQIAPQINDNLQRKTPQTQLNNTAQPPPLVRGNQPQVPMKPTNIQAQQQPQRGLVNVPNKSQGQGPPPLVMAPKVDQRQLEKQMKLLQEHQVRQRQQSLSNNPQQQANLAGFRGTQAQADALRQLQQVQQRAAEETPEKRQAAAKLALRKQLEKTLLQIPPPKPPPPEMNFIPSLASPDFIYLLGLEEAVNFIIDTNLISKGKKSPDEKMVCNPFTCVQCGTDFTPVWKREKPGSKNVICEQCVTSNQKKALKQEHTNRLKNAFVKALQQEQEIERMQSQELKAAAAAGTLSASSSSSSLKEKSEPRERDSRDASARSAAAQAQAYKESMESLRQQHQNLVQAHQAAALRMGQPLGLQFNPRAPFPYQLPFARASDLQRQYLLDMIPKGGLPWNS